MYYFVNVLVFLDSQIKLWNGPVKTSVVQGFYPFNTLIKKKTRIQVVESIHITRKGKERVVDNNHIPIENVNNSKAKGSDIVREPQRSIDQTTCFMYPSI